MFTSSIHNWSFIIVLAFLSAAWYCAICVQTQPLVVQGQSISRQNLFIALSAGTVQLDRRVWLNPNLSSYSELFTVLVHVGCRHCSLGSASRVYWYVCSLG